MDPFAMAPIHTPDSPPPRPMLAVDKAPAASRTLVRVWLGLGIAVALDVPLQLIWKALMIKYGNPNRGPPPGDWLQQVRWFILQARTWALLGLSLGQFVNWMWVLGNADLSCAQPFMALSYVAVSAGAAVFFHERLSPLRMLGIALILVGVMLVGATRHRTTPPLLPPPEAEPT